MCASCVNLHCGLNTAEPVRTMRTRSACRLAPVFAAADLSWVRSVFVVTQRASAYSCSDWPFTSASVSWPSARAIRSRASSLCDSRPITASGSLQNTAAVALPSSAVERAGRGFTSTCSRPAGAHQLEGAAGGEALAGAGLHGAHDQPLQASRRCRSRGLKRSRRPEVQVVVELGVLQQAVRKERRGNLDAAFLAPLRVGDPDVVGRVMTVIPLEHVGIEAACRLDIRTARLRAATAEIVDPEGAEASMQARTQAFHEIRPAGRVKLGLVNGAN